MKQFELATKTKEMIDMTIESDQGSSYRNALKKWFPTVEDIYRPSGEKSHRGHLGASVIGGECSRQIWYNYRWCTDAKHKASLIRLFNTGNIFEAKFCAMLDIIGCDVMQYDKETGKQFSVSAINGFFGGSGDGIALHVPDIPNGELCLLEMKSHGDSSFKSLVKKGVRVSKPIHVIQMEIYMELMGIKYGLYMAGSKNTDEIHLEIIEANTYVAQHFLERAEHIIYADNPPKREFKPDSISCKWCDMAFLCHLNNTDSVDVSCRTCKHSYPSQHENEAGQWCCSKFMCIIPKANAMQGCSKWEMRNLV